MSWRWLGLGGLFLAAIIWWGFPVGVNVPADDAPETTIRPGGWVSVNGLRRARQGLAAHAMVTFAVRLSRSGWNRFVDKSAGVTPGVTDDTGKPIEQTWEALPLVVDQAEDAVMGYYAWIATRPFTPGTYAVGVRTDSEDDLARMGRIRTASLTVASDVVPEATALHRRRVRVARGEYEAVVQELEAIAVEQPDSAFLGMELIDAYLAAGRLDEAEAAVRQYLHRLSCGRQPAPCRPHDRATHYLMPYLDQIRAARAAAP